MAEVSELEFTDAYDAGSRADDFDAPQARDAFDAPPPRGVFDVEEADRLAA